MEDLVVRYYYDSILDRNVYGVPPIESEVSIMKEIAKLYSKLSKEGRDYTRVRLEMLEEADVNCEKENCNDVSKD